MKILKLLVIGSSVTLCGLKILKILNLLVIGSSLTLVWAKDIENPQSACYWVQRHAGCGLKIMKILNLLVIGSSVTLVTLVTLLFIVVFSKLSLVYH